MRNVLTLLPLALAGCGGVPAASTPGGVAGGVVDGVVTVGEGVSQVGRATGWTALEAIGAGIATAATVLGSIVGVRRLARGVAREEDNTPLTPVQAALVKSAATQG